MKKQLDEKRKKANRLSQKLEEKEKKKSNF